MASSVLWGAVTSFFQYNTPRIVHIKDTTIGVTNRCIQFLIIGYIIGFAIVYKKGYQEVDFAKSAVTTKVKGIEYYNNSLYKAGTLDVAEYVIPPQETDAFFVMTGFIKTALQTPKTCPESPYIEQALCHNNSQCETLIGTILPKGNGPITGQCVPSSIPGHPNVCEIYGWCPVEDDNPDQMMTFDQILNFTVFIKNNIEFPKFGISKRNILDIYYNDSELSNCLWNGNNQRDKYCPIFLLGDIIKGLGMNYTTLLKSVQYGDACLSVQQVYEWSRKFQNTMTSVTDCSLPGQAHRVVTPEDCVLQESKHFIGAGGFALNIVGGLIKIVISWNCDLDNSVDDCLPQYSFIQLDKGDYTSSVGFNFRYADHFYEKTPDTYKFYRNLYKVYGIHFLVDVQGQAGKFGIVPLLLNIGSGLALLGIATVLCDIIVLYLLKAKKFYRQMKYLDVTANDAFEGPRTDSDRGLETSGKQYRRHSRQELTDPDGDLS